MGNVQEIQGSQRGKIVYFCFFPYYQDPAWYVTGSIAQVIGGVQYS